MVITKCLEGSILLHFLKSKKPEGHIFAGFSGF
jgi:hypothetical protein